MWSRGCTFGQNPAAVNRVRGRVSARIVPGGVSALVAGRFNTVDGNGCAIVGGQFNTTNSNRNVVVGGLNNFAGNASPNIAYHSVVVGGEANQSAGAIGVVSGGADGIVTGEHDWVAGSLFEDD